MLKNGGTDGLSDDPRALRTGQNGGYQSIGIAVLAGAARIVLLGYDMQYTGGKSHWHGGHPQKVPEVWYTQAYARHFKWLAETCSLPIINASAETSLKCFPRMSIEEALEA